MRPFVNRRTFLQSTAVATLGPALSATAVAAAAGAVHPPIIDTHTHFYDPARPEGVPWPGKQDPLLYRTTLPKDYRQQAVPHPVTATVVVEASPWVEDNQWILDLAARDPFIVGLVGNLPVGTPEFAALLKRFAANPVFRGLRVNHAALQKGLTQALYLDDLRRLADADLELDINGGPTLLPDAARLAEKLPNLRIVINHVANVRIDGKAPPTPWLEGIRAAAAHPRVFCKVSALVEGTGRSDASAPRAVDFYRPILDAVWQAFGEDRLIYGSNWPVSQRFAPLATVQAIAADYFAAKGPVAREKFFARNAATAYRWIKR